MLISELRREDALMPHQHRHCVYCGKLSGDARACVTHSPLVLIDPYFAPFWLEVRT